MARMRWMLGCVVAATGLPAAAQMTFRVSVDSQAHQGTGDSDVPGISADGRYVVFESRAPDLVPFDSNQKIDVFVRDRHLGATERVSVTTYGAQANDDCHEACISRDGRFVAFESAATTLARGDANGKMDVFVRDRLLGTTERVSLGAADVEGDGDSRTPSISADGRFVAFTSAAGNLVPGDANGVDDVFVRDRLLGTTERVSVDSSGVEGDGASQRFPTISADGRYVVFASRARNLVALDTNAEPDVFLRDRLSGTTERTSVAWNGAEGNGPCDAHAAITADGHFVAFASFATNLVVPDGWGHADVFVRDRQVGTTYRASLGSVGNEPNAGCFVPSITDDGRFVAFETAATNITFGELNLTPDIFLRDLLAQTTERVSVGWHGGGGIPPCSTRSALTPDGRYLAFASSADTLVVDDSNGKRDVFVRDLRGGTSFTLLCEPGSGGTIACPCANPPSSGGRGCDNAAATGGATLEAGGTAMLSRDELVFTANDLPPNATCLLVQGASLVGGGSPYGRGLRCADGSLTRLYTKIAAGGGVTVPVLPGDATVSATSAALGSPIPPAQSRWYFVYYEDPIVAGGCPASSAYNATPTGRVDWSP